MGTVTLGCSPPPTGGGRDSDTAALGGPPLGPPFSRLTFHTEWTWMKEETSGQSPLPGLELVGRLLQNPEVFSLSR